MRPKILDALEYTAGTHKEEDVLREILQGKIFMWVGERSLVITETTQYPQMAALKFVLAAGELHELIQMHEHITSLAKEKGITRFEICGRGGWEDKLDYRRVGIYMVKDDG